MPTTTTTTTTTTSTDPARVGSSDPSTRAGSARIGVYAVFILAGVLFASFASRIPQVKLILGLSPSELGLVLLGGMVGSILGLPAAGWAANRFGVARTVFVGSVVASVALASGAFAVEGLRSRWVLVLALFVGSFAIGIWDVSMNLEGAAVERRLGRTIMPRFHAGFSGGTVVAALGGSAATAVGIPIRAHLLGIGAICIGLCWWGTRRFLDDHRDPHAPHDDLSPSDDLAPHDDLSPSDDLAPRNDLASRRPAAGAAAPRRAWSEPRTLLIGVVVLIAAFTEGTANDWLAIAMVEGHGLPAWAGVLGFATFLAAMTIGRLAGTHWLDRYGRVRVLRALWVLAVAGALLVVFGGPWLAFVGAACWGVGASLGFPVGMSAGADEPARAAARVSVISTIGYAAFLAGPPLLGLLGDRVGVLHSLLLVGLAAVLALAIVPAVREPAAVSRGPIERHPSAG